MPSKNHRKTKSAEQARGIKAAIASGSYSLDQAQEIARVFVEGISDPEWSKITATMPLPDLARRRIDEAIKKYWEAKIIVKIDPRIRGEITEATGMASKLMGRIKKLAHDANFFKGVYDPHDKSPSEQRQQLADVYVALNQLELLLHGAQSRLKTPLGRPSFGPIMRLIATLDFILHEFQLGGVTFAKKNSDESKNRSVEYVRIVTKIAEPIVKDSSVDTILKEYLRLLPKWGEEIYLWWERD